jgi:hypothetical protein
LGERERKGVGELCKKERALAVVKGTGCDVGAVAGAGREGVGSLGEIERERKGSRRVV